MLSYAGAAALLVLLFGLGLAWAVWRVSKEKKGAGPVGAPAANPTPLHQGPAGSLAAALNGGASGVEFLSQFVLDPQGARVGETVGFEASVLVVKREGKFATVGLDLVFVEKGLLVLRGAVEWESAFAAGEEWRKKTHDVIQYDEKGMPVVK
ncbi:MAG: DUF5749 family beta-barrel protein [Methanobacteriota archaeon]